MIHPDLENLAFFQIGPVHINEKPFQPAVIFFHPVTWDQVQYAADHPSDHHDWSGLWKLKGISIYTDSRVPKDECLQGAKENVELHLRNKAKAGFADRPTDERPCLVLAGDVQ